MLKGVSLACMVEKQKFSINHSMYKDRLENKTTGKQNKTKSEGHLPKDPCVNFTSLLKPNGNLDVP